MTFVADSSFDPNAILNGGRFTVTLNLSSTVTGDFSVNYLGRTSWNESGQSVTERWEYSLDGGKNWTYFSPVNTIADGTSWNSYTWTVSGQTVNGSIQFRDTLGASTTPSAINVDFSNLNLGFTPVPEPTHYALAIFGLMFVSAGVGRFGLAKLRRA